MKQYYDKKYLSWQKTVGAFGGQANLIKFSDYISVNDRVIDFGCGGGYLLNNVNCRDKIGIEVNPSARKLAETNGLKAVASYKAIPNNWADVIISNHVLEHTENPLQVIKQLLPKLKKGGKIIFVVPCDTYHYAYNPQDINKHLFSWSPMNLGNLFTAAGYKVIISSPFLHKWPKHYILIAKIFGMKFFHLLSWIIGHFDREWSQVRIIATR